MISFVKNIALHYNFDQYYTEELNILVEKIMNKYDFLVIKEEAWESVFKKIIAKTKSLTEIEFKIEKSVKDLINRLASIKETIYLNNLIVKMARENIVGKEALEKFFSFVSFYKIKFDEEYFNKLKRESNAFNKLLVSLKIENYTFKQVENYVKGYYKEYLLLKPYNETLDWTIDTFNYIKSLLNYNLSTFAEANIRNNKDYKLVKLILIRYKELDELYNLFIDKIMVVRRRQFDLVVFNFSYQELEELFKEYAVYKTIGQDKGVNFLFKIASRIKALKEVNKKNIDALNFSDEKKVRYKRPKIKITTVYDLFTYGDKTLEEKKPIIDYLLSKCEDKTRKGIDAFVNGTISKEEKHNISSLITRLRRSYKTWVDTGKVPSKNVTATVYDLFTYGDKTLEEKKPAIDYLLSRCEEKTRVAIQEYVSKTMDKEKIPKFLPTLTQLRFKYELWVDLGKLPAKSSTQDYLTIYDLFTYGNKPLEEKKPIIDYLLSRSEDKIRKKIDAFIEGTLPKAEKHSITSLISRLRSSYKIWVDTGKIPGGINKSLDMVYLINIISDLGDKDRFFKELNSYSAEKIHLMAISLKLRECRVREEIASKEEYEIELKNTLNKIIEDNNDISLEELFKVVNNKEEDVRRK